ncbi:MAG: SUMF1/EgtB/PvdO family nonheme iron enzyme, partial [Myxococcales bacterium]|nr:SUMF1/EgtB/PvdO family nonheme iron enzyme [Myxococcales bacterium]
MRARSEQRRARFLVVVLLGLGMGLMSLSGCERGAPSVTPETAAGSVAWMPGQGQETEADASDPEDDGTHDLVCQQDPEAPGCPWDRNATNFGDEGVWGNGSPDNMPLPEPEGPTRCPDSAVMSQMIEIPAGEFVMGCDSLDSHVCGKAERKRSVVDLPAFSIDRNEVTQAAY